ncbi:DNA-(apurinic or apyrimidinic site) lyase [Sinobacterium caligoides]|uniref:Formamidopyrimidine-DNA glycosylase n=1 Tax=Sinobacterium caligoides TaxID=933926 RepID=A0A3N2DGP2_9GAMM|nr:bifunctional DNA-formamidopyrimidine glycosylase/DNA-(apurinic or apyrimidinic site) lyase [Sinobacterium caligoides]ROR98950.1 DNA-(apurinic or apyrimidinic site) lyase [Sinobacterium caligoides]
MPELPEVETTLRGIEPHLAGRKIVGVVVRQAQLRWPIPDDLSAQLAGREILACFRRAKYLLFALPNGHLLIHLGMSGSLRLTSESDPGRHDHVDIVLDSGKILRYHDPRRFGAVLWLDGPVSEHRLFAHLGPEPLLEDFDERRLFVLSRGRKTPVKTFIMDNQVVVGVGNIYANEALFMAGIKPLAMAGGVSRQRYARLTLAIKQVLEKAIAEGGTTLKDFVGGDGKPGYFQQQLNVYGRTGEACVKCDGVLKEVKIAGRSSVFCARCQR